MKPHQILRGVFCTVAASLLLFVGCEDDSDSVCDEAIEVLEDDCGLENAELDGSCDAEARRDAECIVNHPSAACEAILGFPDADNAFVQCANS